METRFFFHLKNFLNIFPLFNYCFFFFKLKGVYVLEKVFKFLFPKTKKTPQYPQHHQLVHFFLACVKAVNQAKEHIKNLNVRCKKSYFYKQFVELFFHLVPTCLQYGQVIRFFFSFSVSLIFKFLYCSITFNTHDPFFF